MRIVSDDAYGEMNFARVSLRTGRDRVEPRRQFPHDTDKGIGCDLFGWKVVQDIDDLATMEVGLQVGFFSRV